MYKNADRFSSDEMLDFWVTADSLGRCIVEECMYICEPLFYYVPTQLKFTVFSTVTYIMFIIIVSEYNTDVKIV